jgi:hypothetical protein
MPDNNESTTQAGTRDYWPTTITAVDNPLKFFALCLLIVEALIAILAVKSEDMLVLGLIGMSLFLFVVVMVVFMMMRYPAPLTAKAPNELVNMAKNIEKKVRPLQNFVELTKTISPDILAMKPEANPKVTQSGLPIKQTREKRF